MFNLSGLTITPEEVTTGSSVTIEVFVTNSGELTGTYSITIKIDETIESTKEVTLAGGNSQKVTFTTSKATAKTYAVAIGELSDTFVVKAPPPEPPAPTPIPTPEVKSVKLTDVVDDLFDKSGNPIKDQPYLDIVEAELTISDSDSIARIKLNGPIPAVTPDPQIFLEWTIYLDLDSNTSTGDSWTLVANDLGFEYLARLMLLDSNYFGQLYNISTKKGGNIEYKITDNVIELRWTQKSNWSDTFNFTVAAKKYGERGVGSAFILADKAPNSFHANFPTGEVLDTDKDGFTDEEETSLMKTDPNVGEKWDDLNTVTSILDTPKKVSVYLERKFKSVREPSTPFATPVTQLFKEMSGDCDEYAIMAIYWLTKNNYESYMLQVDFNEWWQEYNMWLRHDICVYQDKNGSWYSIDIYFHGSGRNPVGPFNSIEDICSLMPSHYGATDWISYSLYDNNGKLMKTTNK